MVWNYVYSEMSDILSHVQVLTYIDKTVKISQKIAYYKETSIQMIADNLTMTTVQKNPR